MARKPILHAELEAVYDAVKDYIEKFSRLQSELSKPPEDLLYVKLALANIAMSLKKIIDAVNSGKSLLAESESCALSSYIARLLSGGSGIKSNLIDSLRPLLVAVKSRTDSLCKPSSNGDNLFPNG